MNRREFVQAGLTAPLVAGLISESLAAQVQPTAPPVVTLQPRKLILDAYSRCFHWLRSPDEVAEAAIEMTCGGVMPTVGNAPAHISLENVAKELPAFVKRLQSHGLRVWQIRGTGATEATAPNIEALVASASQAGAKFYWLGTDRYDLTKPIYPQLDALKFRVEKFVKMNQKYNMTLLYHTRAGAESIGSAMFDLLYVMKDFDPKYVAFHYDTGHMSNHASGMWELGMRAAGPYLAAVSWKDHTWRQGAEPAAPQADAPPAAAAAGRGARGAGGRGGGRGTQAAPADLTGRGNGWNGPQVPMGAGVVDIVRIATVLRDLNFNGPMELEAEYPLGGAESGADKITIPRSEVMAALKRDVETIRRGFQESGSGLSI